MIHHKTHMDWIWDFVDIHQLLDRLRCGPTKDIFGIEFWLNKKEKAMAPNDAVRTFDTGATRDSEVGKLDFEGFLSPNVLERYAEYMNKHRIQADGKLRDSDNWQKGIPVKVYMKSLWRHFFDVWKLYRGWPVLDKKDGHEIFMEEALCAVIFNAMGHLHVLTDANKAALSAAEEDEIKEREDENPDTKCITCMLNASGCLHCWTNTHEVPCPAFKKISYSKVCSECLQWPRTCSENSKKLQFPCPGFERHQ